MLSLYLHIPFCSQICSYCSFSITANQPTEIIQSYLTKLHQEIDFYASKYPKAEIKTLYFWGGTPNLIGAEEIKKLIDHIFDVFDCENLAELSIECNPFPADDILSFIKSLNQTYKKISRLRFSFWIQSLDNGVLQQANRPYTFPWMVDFLRNLQPLKQDNNIFNLDFIAFGHFNQTKKGNLQLRTDSALSFFSDVANSHFADSFSLYTLEFSEHQLRNRKKAEFQQHWAFGTEDEIYEEFDILKNILFDAGYSRYEISNFSLMAKSSIHNRVYREMEPYLGLGLWASGFVREEKSENAEISNISRIRTQNTPYLPKYLAIDFDTKIKDRQDVTLLDSTDFLIEKFFLALRTDRGVQKISEFSSVLIPDYLEKIQQMKDQELVIWEENNLKLTDRGMDCYNRIVTELLAEI